MNMIGGIKIGGLQQKIFNLMLIFIAVLIGAYAVINVYQQKSLRRTVQETNTDQQASITEVSEQTMQSVLNSSMTQTTALQAYIANDLFADVRTGVETLRAFAEELFAHADSFSGRPYSPPAPAAEGTLAVQFIHEEGVDPADSEMLGLAANMSGIMQAMYTASDKLSSIFIGTADGNMILVNDRPETFLAPDGTTRTLDIRHRPWYVRAAEAGELVFTGVELDAYTDTPMLECAAPVYCGGELAAVVSADIWLTSISEYVESKASDGSFLCVVNENGQMLFSPAKEGVFRVELSSDAPDLRRSENKALADFVTKALKENTGLQAAEIGGKEYFLCGVPLETLGWAVISVVDKQLTDRPAEMMLSRYDEINRNASAGYEQEMSRIFRLTIILTVLIVVLAVAAALLLASRVVRPVEHMTKRINALGGTDQVFRMEDVYRTGDEIEVLAESFATLTERAEAYIEQITEITAEKERIGTELALATRIQADMLPNIYPAFPDRPEFDIYASMDPAKEVGGDFYDFFLVDDDHLCMIIADVSGKGVPAALFMMASKIILQNNAMMGKSPARILSDTNTAICANNREEMFVTAWLGILEISTGKLTAANAGHEYPAVCHPDGLFELVQDKHSFVIGGLEGVKYKEYSLTLAPGTKLFLYTDGVPEAMDAENTLFGTDRMLAALNAKPDAAPEKVVNIITTAVEGFVNDAEQFDDLTLLCMEYKGKKS